MIDYDVKDISLARKKPGGFEEYRLIMQPNSVIVSDASNNLTMVNTSSFATSGTSSYSVTSSYTLLSENTIHSISASWASQSLSSSHAINANIAHSISFIPIICISSSWVSSSILIETAKTASFVSASNVTGTVNSSSLAQLANTASYALQALSASTASYYGGSVTSSSFATTSSYVTNTISASFATSASYANTASYYGGSVTSASYSLSCSLAKSASYVAGNNVDGNVAYADRAIDADSADFVAGANVSGQVSSSVNADFATNASFADDAGSAGNAIQLGNTSSLAIVIDNQIWNFRAPLSGSVISASVIVPANNTTGLQITASLFGTASYALTASFALNGGGSTLTTGSTYEITSSWSNSSISSSHALNANNAYAISFVPVVSISASHASSSISSSYSVSSSYARNTTASLSTPFFLYNTGSNKMVELTNNTARSGRIGSTLKFYNPLTQSLVAEIGSDIDEGNPTTDALYIIAPTSNGRIYLGRSGKIVFSLDLTYTTNIINPPTITFAKGKEIRWGDSNNAIGVNDNSTFHPLVGNTMYFKTYNLAANHGYFVWGGTNQSSSMLVVPFGTGQNAKLGIGNNITASSLVNTLTVLGNISCSVVTASFNNRGVLIPVIQAGSASVSAATTDIVVFSTPMSNVNYVVSLTGESAITTPSIAGKTLNGFTSSFSVYTGIYDWIAVGATQ